MEDKAAYKVKGDFKITTEEFMGLK